MKTSAHRAAALSCALLASTCLVAPAMAQTTQAYRQIDDNGVDLTHGDFVMSFREGSIGSGKAELALIRERANFQGSQWDAYTFKREVSSMNATITIGLPGRVHERFTGGSNATSFTHTKGSGATLTRSLIGYTYTAPDGTTIHYYDPNPSWEIGQTTNFCASNNLTASVCYLLPQTIATPGSGKVELSWFTAELNDGWGNISYEWRLDKVANSFGYSAEFTYPTNSWDSGGYWRTRTGAQFRNSLHGSTVQGTIGYAYPSSSVYTIDITDMAGQTWRVTDTSIRRPGESSPSFSISSVNNVTSVTKDGVTTSYSRSVSGTTGTMTVTNALNQQTVVTSNLSIGRPTSVTDPINRTSSYQYDSYGRLTRVTAPEGNYTQYTYDPRGNITETRMRDKAGNSSNDIVTSAVYPSTCSNPKTCNKPTSTTDANGNVTEYEYDSTYGSITRVTLAAPTTNAVRPQTRYTYQATTYGSTYPLQAVVHELKEISTCQTLAGASGGTAAACANGADEVRTLLGYDFNGNVNSVTNGNGSGTLTATTNATYDGKGDLLTVDGPLPGSADTLRYRYDAARRQIGIVSPDPDGSGSLKHRARRSTLGADGRVLKVENGTVNSQSDSDWAAFSALEGVEIGYSNGRPVTQKLVSGSTAYALNQTSYDALGRPECSAQRMNPSVYSSLPGACSLGTEGSFGPDRISKTVYDAAGQVTQARSAVETTLEAAEATFSYTPNGKLEYVIDAKGNRSKYVYDGHDRQSHWYLPSPTSPSSYNDASQTAALASAGSINTADYEQYGYDANGNRTSFRNRAGQMIYPGYDALNRLISKDLPNNLLYEADQSFSYDNLGRLTSATDVSISVVIGYDALGRKTSEGNQHFGYTSFQYDAAGRRTSMTWKDGFYVTYEHLVTGETSVIRENGSTALASFGYDDLGRRTSLTRGNGTSTSYSFDAVSRLSQLGQDLSGTGHDLTLGFSYNPASQITQNTRSNDAYAWTNHYNVNRGYTSNGLNQYTASGSVTPTYDAKGNVTSAGGTTYGYTAENLLMRVNGSDNLVYDPLGRLYFTTQPISFVYDGTEMIAELDYTTGNPIARRYVHGPGVDEPLVWYEGSGTSDRRWLHADERGSIIAITNGSGVTTNVNAYDEYGIPQSSNEGRFQYTGQTWLPELGMYYYKARIYSPTLGRFLQPDQIGYGDGMNMYAYVGSDPINLVDSSGNRAMTPGEKGMMRSILPVGINFDALSIHRNPFSDRGFVGPRNHIWFGVDYMDDFSLSSRTSSQRDTFLHEMWHVFEKSIGLTSQGMLTANQIGFGFSNSAYDWVQGNGQMFRHQNPEVRANTFAKCFTGNGEACSRMEGFSYSGAYSGGRIHVSFSDGTLRITYSYKPIGSLITRTVTFESKPPTDEDEEEKKKDKKKGG
jgi:RHS repeat-associated protein